MVVTDECSRVRVAGPHCDEHRCWHGRGSGERLRLCSAVSLPTSPIAPCLYAPHSCCPSPTCPDASHSHSPPTPPQSFSNLRSRGSGLCDIAVLVVDLMHGLEQQTRESIKLLRMRKTPFIIALNKVDRLYGWEAKKDAPIRASFGAQKQFVEEEFRNRREGVGGALTVTVGRTTECTVDEATSMVAMPAAPPGRRRLRLP